MKDDSNILDYEPKRSKSPWWQGEGLTASAVFLLQLGCMGGIVGFWFNAVAIVGELEVGHPIAVRPTLLLTGGDAIFAVLGGYLLRRITSWDNRRLKDKYGNKGPVITPTAGKSGE